MNPQSHVSVLSAKGMWRLLALPMPLAHLIAWLLNQFCLQGPRCGLVLIPGTGWEGASFSEHCNA
jgi:hypothetical protein